MPYRSATDNDSLTISNLNCFVFSCTVFCWFLRAPAGNSSKSLNWQSIHFAPRGVENTDSWSTITAGSKSMATSISTSRVPGSPGCLCQWTRASLLPRGVWHPFDFSSICWPRRTCHLTKMDVHILHYIIWCKELASHMLGFVAHLKTKQWKATTNPWPKERILSTQLPWREGKYLRFPPCPSWSSNTAMSQPFFPAFFPACKAAASPWLCGNAATTQKGYTQYPRYIVPLTTLNIHRCHWSETNGLLATALPPSFCSCGPWRKWNKIIGAIQTN